MAMTIYGTKDIHNFVIWRLNFQSLDPELTLANLYAQRIQTKRVNW